MRFTLGKMFLAIGMLALACAGMMYRNRWWADGIEAISLLLFAAVGIWAISLDGRGRAKAFSFAVIGTCYLLLSTTISERSTTLPTNYILAAVGTLLPESQKNDDPFGPELPLTFQQLLEMRPLSGPESFRYFFVIGHCVFSWLFAVLAAWFAGRMWDRRERSFGPNGD